MVKKSWGKFWAILAGLAIILGGGGLTVMATAQAANTVPAYDHIVTVIEENESSTNIIGSSSAPYINSLAAQGANFTDAHGEAHPSQPNYLAFFSGSTQGVTDDTVRAYSGPNLATQMAGGGKTFVGYSQGLNSGTNWKQYHSPWLQWSTTTAAQKQDWTAFPTSGNYANLPKDAIVVPDACNDMHDCSVSTGDTWLKNNMDAYAQWAKTHNSLLIVTWDEDGGVGGTTSGNHIATVMVGANITPGNYSQTINHYNMLGMIQDSVGVPRLNNSVGAAAITAPFTTSTTTPPPTTTTPPPPPNDGTQAAVTQGWGTSTGGDEFNYVGAPDSTKWTPYNSAGNAGQGVRSPSQLWVDTDHLSIAGKSDGTTGGLEAKFGRQLYGRWEARIRTGNTDPKYHAVSILWPDTDTSKCNEIDYSEQSGDLANDHFYLHYGCSSPTVNATKALDVTQYHNYAVDWSPAAIIGYVDGVEWFRDTDPTHISQVSMHQTFQLDWFPVTGQATAADWMDIDWVRTYTAAAVAPTAAVLHVVPGASNTFTCTADYNNNGPTAQPCDFVTALTANPARGQVLLGHGDGWIQCTAEPAGTSTHVPCSVP